MSKRLIVFLFIVLAFKASTDVPQVAREDDTYPVSVLSNGIFYEIDQFGLVWQISYGPERPMPESNTPADVLTAGS